MRFPQPNNSWWGIFLTNDVYPSHHRQILVTKVMTMHRVTPYILVKFNKYFRFLPAWEVKDILSPTFMDRWYATIAGEDSEIFYV